MDKHVSANLFFSWWRSSFRSLCTRPRTPGCRTASATTWRDSQGRISLNPRHARRSDWHAAVSGIAFFHRSAAARLGASDACESLCAGAIKRVANFWVSIAGMLGNLLIAIVAGIIIRVLFDTGVLDKRLRPSDSEIAMGAVNCFSGLLHCERRAGDLQPAADPAAGREQDSEQHPAASVSSSAIESLEQFGFIMLFIALFTGVFQR